MPAMNIHSVRSSQSSYGDPRYLSTTSVGTGPPPNKVLLDGYQNVLDTINDEPRYEPRDSTAPRGPAVRNVQDPVAIHLLAETAITDSVNYDVLTFEELEELKREYALLTNRIKASKRKLALESKLRDAAQSLSRLYTPKSSRDSSDFSQMNGNGISQKPDDEFVVSKRKCEDLAQEVWNLEQRAQDVQRRLLQHTAGVLQMTHKGLKKKRKSNIPETPETFYDDGPAGAGLDDFDDRSLYKPLDYLDEFPPVPGQRAFGNPAMDMQAIRNTEKRLEELNSRMREMIMDANPDENFDAIPQPAVNGAAANPEATLQAHLAYMENGLAVIESQKGREGPQAQNAQVSNYELDGELEGLCVRITHVLGDSTPVSPAFSPPPGPGEPGFQSHLANLSAGIDTIEKKFESFAEQKGILTTQIQQQRELNSKSDAQRDEHIGKLTEEIAHLKKDLDVSQRELSMVMEQLDTSRQDSNLEQQQETSRLQNALRQAESDLEQARNDAEMALQDARIDSEAALADARGEADAAVREAREAKETHAAEISRLETLLGQVRYEADNASREANDAQQAEISRLETMLQQTRGETDAAAREAQEARQAAEERAERLQTELTEMESEVVRTQTELTIAKAELDGAYGTRAQRAAEVAANPAIQKEIDELTTRNLNLTEQLAAVKAEQGSRDNAGSAELQSRVELLEKELRDTIEDYEVMAKSSIEFEKEREKLEALVDELRDRCENLESQLSDEKIQWMGVKNPGTGASAETTSSMVLKTEFKRMMRETRMESMRMIKAEQEERRRLEALIRSMKKEQANGKSSLSQSTVASP